jgi:hypothetical protein
MQEIIDLIVSGKFDEACSQLQTSSEISALTRELRRYDLMPCANIDEENILEFISNWKTWVSLNFTKHFTISCLPQEALKLVVAASDGTEDTLLHLCALQRSTYGVLSQSTIIGACKRAWKEFFDDHQAEGMFSILYYPKQAHGALMGIPAKDELENLIADIEEIEDSLEAAGFSKITDWYAYLDGFDQLRSLSIPHAPYTNDDGGVEGVDVHKWQHITHELKRHLPCNLKQLEKSGRQQLVQAITGNKEVFANLFHNDMLRQVTEKDVATFERSLGKDTYEIAFQGWAGIQRSRKKDLFQWVALVQFGPKLEKEISALYGGKYLLDAYNRYNQDQDSHPTGYHTLGWIRFDFDPTESWLLVDEIQSDWYNFCVNNDEGREAIVKGLKKEDKEDKEKVDEVCKKLSKAIDHVWPDVAVHAITSISKTNEVKKIYWHTFEGGLKLKGIGSTGKQPPKSAYTSVPKKHFFKVTPDNPVKLPADFYVREAKTRP